MLRSNEIIVPPGGLLDTELDLSFSLQVRGAIVKPCLRVVTSAKLSLVPYQCHVVNRARLSHNMLILMDTANI